MQHLFDMLRLTKLTEVFIAVGCVVGEFWIDQRATHIHEGRRIIVLL